MNRALGAGRRVLHTFSKNFEIDFVCMNHHWIFHNHKKEREITHFYFLQRHLRKRNLSSEMQNVFKIQQKMVKTHISRYR